MKRCKEGLFCGLCGVAIKPACDNRKTYLVLTVKCGKYLPVFRVLFLIIAKMNLIISDLEEGKKCKDKVKSLPKLSNSYIFKIPQEMFTEFRNTFTKELKRHASKTMERNGRT